MNEQQEIRAKALEAASRIAQPGSGVRALTDTAAILATWIETGSLPEPAAGTYFG